MRKYTVGYRKPSGPHFVHITVNKGESFTEVFEKETCAYYIDITFICDGHVRVYEGD